MGYKVKSEFNWSMREVITRPPSDPTVVFALPWIIIPLLFLVAMFRKRTPPPEDQKQNPPWH